MVEYSSQRLDHNRCRARGDSHPRQLGLLRVREQHLLPELREQPLTDSSSNRQRWLRHNLSHHSYSTLLHHAEYQTEWRSGRGGPESKKGPSEEDPQEATDQSFENRENLTWRSFDRSKTKRSHLNVVQP